MQSLAVAWPNGCARFRSNPSPFRSSVCARVCVPITPLVLRSGWHLHMHTQFAHPTQSTVSYLRRRYDPPLCLPPPSLSVKPSHAHIAHMFLHHTCAHTMHTRRSPTTIKTIALSAHPSAWLKYRQTNNCFQLPLQTMSARVNPPCRNE